MSISTNITLKHNLFTVTKTLKVSVKWVATLLRVSGVYFRISSGDLIF